MSPANLAAVPAHEGGNGAGSCPCGVEPPCLPLKIVEKRHDDELHNLKNRVGDTEEQVGKSIAEMRATRRACELSTNQSADTARAAKRAADACDRMMVPFNELLEKYQASQSEPPQMQFEGLGEVTSVAVHSPHAAAARIKTLKTELADTQAELADTRGKVDKLVESQQRMEIEKELKAKAVERFRLWLAVAIPGGMAVGALVTWIARTFMH